MISTRNLEGMPDIAGLRRLTRSLAMLDAILSPEWEYRYYSFDSQWAEGELMASMRNGQGDHWFALFTSAGAALHGLAHESPMYRPDDPWPGIFSDLPSDFAGFLHEPAFDTRNSTFCIWRRVGDAEWHRGEIAFASGPDPDGSAELLHLLDGRPTSYQTFAKGYEVDLPLTAIESIYRHEPLSEALLEQLNSAIDLTSLQPDIDQIGYPENSSRDAGPGLPT